MGHIWEESYYKVTVLCMMFESDVIGDGERVKGGLCAFPCRCTAVHAHLCSSIIWKHSWCYPYELPFFIQFAFHHKALPNVRQPHPHMLCTTPGLCAPVAVPVCDNTTHRGTAVHTLNTCLQPVEVIYEYNYPSLVKLVYWLEGELGVSTPLCQTLRHLVQKSMSITFIDGRVIVCILPEVCLTSRGNLREGRRKRRCSKCCESFPECLIPECLIVKMSNPKMSNPKMSNEVLIRSSQCCNLTRPYMTILSHFLTTYSLQK